MKMIQEPKFFDVMVTENTFGDILTDEGSVISGSMGLLPSASTGESTPVFEPIHGSWPQAKGLNIANRWRKFFRWPCCSNTSIVKLKVH